MDFSFTTVTLARQPPKPCSPIRRLWIVQPLMIVIKPNPDKLNVH
jgi:hypothetical protein